MKKRMLLPILEILLIPLCLVAQEQSAFIGASLQITQPIGDFNKVEKGNSTTGFGISGDASYYLLSRITQVGAEIGYTKFGKKSSATQSNILSSQAVAYLFKNKWYYKFSEHLTPYVLIGYGGSTQSLNLQDLGAEVNGKVKSSVLCFGIGTETWEKSNEGFDFSIRYYTVNSNNRKIIINSEAAGRFKGNSNYLQISLGAKYGLF